jgi:hypothetical protein
MRARPYDSMNLHEEGDHHGPKADVIHNSMLSNVSECEVLITRGARADTETLVAREIY